MADINIPGDDIESARDNMQQVLQLFGSSASSTDSLTEGLGSDGLVLNAAKDFDKRWSDGRTQLKDEGKSIIDALTKVINTFTDTDNQAANELTSGDGSSSSSS